MARFRTEGREGFSRLKPGQYHWKVEEAENAYSRGGDDQIRLILKVGDKSGTMQIKETLTFSEKAFFRVEHFIKSAGVYPGDGVDVDLRAEDCIGLKGVCEMVDEKNKNTGKTYAKIGNWLEAQRQDASFLGGRTQAPASSHARRHEQDYATTNSRSSYADDIPF